MSFLDKIKRRLSSSAPEVEYKEKEGTKTTSGLILFSTAITIVILTMSIMGIVFGNPEEVLWIVMGVIFVTVFANPFIKLQGGIDVVALILQVVLFVMFLVTYFPAVSRDALALGSGIYFIVLLIETRNRVSK